MNRWTSDALPSEEVGKQIFLDLKKNLIVQPHPFTSWRSLPNQKLKTITINENGFRSKSLKNLRFKNNAVLLGGSVAWGLGATCNDNIPSYLIEKILLEKYGLEYNVINLAEQMFTSFEELKTFMSTADELKPKLVISLSGCNDITASYENRFKSNELYRRPANFFSWAIKTGIYYEKNLFKKIVKLILRSFKKNIELNDDFFTTKQPPNDEISTFLLKNKFDWLNSYCNFKNIPIFHFLQPSLFFKKNKSKYEEKYLVDCDKNQSKYIIESNKKLENIFIKNNSLKDKKEFYTSLLKIFDDKKDGIFLDRVHVTDKGYQILSENICSTIKEHIN